MFMQRLPQSCGYFREQAKRETEKRAFLEAYDEGYLWASEPVASAMSDLMEVMEGEAAADNNVKLITQCPRLRRGKSGCAALGRTCTGAVPAVPIGDAKGLWVSCFGDSASGCFFWLNTLIVMLLRGFDSASVPQSC